MISKKAGLLLSGLPFNRKRSGKPRVLLLVDRPGWAFEHSAREIAEQLKDDFSFTIEYIESAPEINRRHFDLVYIFFWGERRHERFGFDADRTIKQVSSHRWMDDPRFGPCSAAEMAATYLADAGTVICTSERLHDLVAPHHPRVFHTPNGISTTRFFRSRDRGGALTLGWAGDARDPVKGLDDIIRPACDGRFRLLLAPGNVGHAEMNAFYNGIDVLLVASSHEGEPLTLLEGMAAGCFPVCTDVGIVPELIRSGENGLIVPDRSPEAFVEALIWCEQNLALVREAGRANAVRIRDRYGWQQRAGRFREVFLDTLVHAGHPLERQGATSG